MSIAGGNFITKSFFRLQFRRVLLPWLKSSAVRCFKDRQYGSSMPVRYIPKKFREIEKPGSFSGSETHAPNIHQKSREVEKRANPPLSDTPNDVEISSSGSNSFRNETRDNWKHAHVCAIPWEKAGSKNRKSFNNLHVNDKPDFDEEMGYHMESMDSQFIEGLEEVDEELEVHNAGTQNDKHRLRACKTKLDAENLAVELLAARAFTAVELRKKLQAKRFPPTIIDAVLCDLQERGLLNDGLYAEVYSRSRWSSSCWGPRRIKQALLKKGVNQVDIENAVKLVFECGEDDDQHLRLGLSKSSMDRLYEQASKQWLRAQDAPRDTRKGRIIRWLQYRGFHWGIVSAILTRLESQYPP